MDFIEEPSGASTTILLVADSNFINLCQNPYEYIERFKERFVALRGGNAELYTVSGRYGISSVDASMPVIEVSDRNKTLFSQTLENSGMLYDELVVFTIVGHDPYIESAKEVVTTANKTYTNYGYPRK